MQCLLCLEIVYEFKETRDGLEQKRMDKIVLKPQETLRLCAMAKSRMRLMRLLRNLSIASHMYQLTALNCARKRPCHEFMSIQIEKGLQLERRVEGQEKEMAKRHLAIHMPQEGIEPTSPTLFVLKLPA